MHEVPGNTDIDVMILHGGAHHLELRLPNDEFDPIDVINVRKLIEEEMVQWISEWRMSPFPRTTPEQITTTPTLITE